MDWSDDDSEEKNHGSDWDIDDDEDLGAAPPIADAVLPGTSREASEAGPSRADWISHFVAMGFSNELVAEAINQNREGDTEGILETLLTYDGFTENVSEDKTIATLVDMGFLAEEAFSSIDRCGPNASILELADSICAARMAEECDDEESDYEDNELWDSPESSSSEDESYEYQSPKEKKRSSQLERKKKKIRIYEGKNEYMKRCKNICDSDNAARLPIRKPMIGFGLPFERAHISHRKLPEAVIGPPFFYYENIALAPKGVWETISRFLYDIEPEFVDSKYFCATARKRGYIHNLPIDNRFPLLPTPPKTIHEAFPSMKKWWPSWDTRTYLNCLMTSAGSAKVNQQIRTILAQSDDPPPQRVKHYVLKQCRRWNLIWIGLHKVAPLEPEEIETLLGFPRNHTRGIPFNERYMSLANSFQIDTVAFHLSVLKNRFPTGITVLSLFSGIGGAEMALHRLGIRLKTVVSVELNVNNRNTVRRWWEDANQEGILIEISDVQELNGDRLEHFINTYGGFDLVIGGSPCNNLSGRNRYTRDGLEGKHSILFYDYFRILDLVKCIMGKK